MSTKTISVPEAQQLLQRGALLVDIRAADEYAREHIAQARHIPMETLAGSGSVPAEVVIFHCRSGNRTQLNAAALGACAREAYVLQGGLDAWKQAGLPVVTDATQPLELQRQVQIVAGTLIVLGAVLGATVSPWFHALSGMIGAGLVFAGVSGFCGLARVLMKMPWNRRAAVAISG